MTVKKKGLGVKGMGIEALINNKLDDIKETSKGPVFEVDINMIEPNRKQPRKHFDELALEELASSLKIHGMIQPVVVKKNKDYYELIAGERRWRAAKIAGLKKIPIIEKKWSEAQAFEVALVENLQRENLNPIEEAQSYKRLHEEFGLSQEKIAEKVGKSRSVVANAMRLLNLDERVMNFVYENKITNGHARALLAITDGEKQFFLAEHIIEEECSVRETEELVKEALLEEKETEVDETGETKPSIDKTVKDEIENSLKSIFSTKVRISQGKNKGKIEIAYYSEEDLDRLLTIMKRMEG